MASISQPLLGAGAEAKNDWASAKAATSLTFTGEGQLRRGFEVAIGRAASLFSTLEYVSYCSGRHVGPMSARGQSERPWGLTNRASPPLRRRLASRPPSGPSPGEIEDATPPRRPRKISAGHGRTAFGTKLCS
jgi:hypothetical protein